MSKKLPADPRDYYVHSDISIEELAKLYDGKKGCSFSNLRKRCHSEDWKRQRDKNGTETVQEIDRKVVQKTAEIVSDLVVRNPLLSKERILQELTHIAYFSMADIADVDDGGAIVYKPFSEVPDSAKRALKKLKEKRRILSAGEGEGDNIVIDSQTEAEPHDKVKALGMIYEYMGYKQPEPPKPDGPDGQPENIAGYIDMWKWTEEQKLIYLATGQAPEESDDTTTT